MVDVEEIDDEGKPLRQDESKYTYKGPSLIDRIRPLWTCWRYCHMSLAIWITLILFSTVCILGALVLASNKSASTRAEQPCNRVYGWVLLWVIINGVNTVSIPSRRHDIAAASVCLVCCCCFCRRR